MKMLLRNRAKVYYALRTGKTKQYDSFGRYTGETAPTYAAPVQYDRLFTQNNTGVIALEPFGLDENYKCSFVTDDMFCPIAEDTRLWVGSEPYDDDNVLLPHTHVVEAVLPSLNVIRIIARQVSVS